MSRSPNSLRGESRFSLGGREFLLRPSFENLVAAEEEIGSLFGLVERTSEGSITLAEITALIWHCIADDPRPPRDQIGSAVLQLGLVNATKPVREVLTQVLQGKL